MHYGPVATVAESAPQAVGKPRGRRLPQYGWAGTLMALLLAWSSVTPSLLPRSTLLQGIVAGISGAFGYGVGETASWAVRRLSGWRPSSAVRARAWSVLGVVGAIVTVVALVAGWRWQVDLHELMDEPAPAAYDWCCSLSSLCWSLSAWWHSGACYDDLTGWVLRRTVGRLPLWLARTIAVVAVVLIVVGVFTGVIFRGFIAVSNAIFSVKDTTTDAGTYQPTSAERSGSPESLIAWGTLGRQGRDFVGLGPDAAQIKAVTGHPALEPVRVYAGLQSAPTVQERVDLAVRDLQRAGGFDREALIVATTTGTGWVDPAAVDAAEYVMGGDTAMVGLQYSYLPSWISFLVDKSKAEEAGAALFDGVYDAWSKLPPDHRPRLYSFGESLGSFGGQSGFTGLEDMRAKSPARCSRAHRTSPSLWASLVADRDAGFTGVPAGLPAGERGALGRDACRPRPAPTPWETPRIAYLQHASDPIVWWSGDLVLHQPDWLREPRGPDVLPAMRWIPWVTFWQVDRGHGVLDRRPDGHGHVYQKEYVDAWAAVLQPEGWTAADTEPSRTAIS